MDEDTHVFFGGPDLEKNALRNILLKAINATPAGYEIKWVCYYLNDPDIVDAIVNAVNRGVNVSIILDAHPRIPDINQYAIDTLCSLNSDLLTFLLASNQRLWKYVGVDWHPHLHSKFYYFSHPQPHAYIGSYNPTADKYHTGAKFTGEIGDHSISHNVLVKITETGSIRTLLEYYSRLTHVTSRRYARFSCLHNKTHRSDQWSISFLPRFRSHPADALFKTISPGTRIKCAISHLKGPGTLKAFKRAIKHNADIELLIETSQRRTDNNRLTSLRNANVKVYQPRFPQDCLMHNKFILYQSPNLQCVMLGSFNWSTRSRLLNYEIIATTSNPGIFNAFEARWNQLVASA